MTRQQVLDSYSVDANGVIRTPGKFEGEPIYAPAYWESALEGAYSFDTGHVFGFALDDAARKEFPELGDAQCLLLEEADQGFVYSELRDIMPDESDLDDDMEAGGA